MRKKLVKIGGTSIGIIIPPTLLRLIGVDTDKITKYDADINIDGKNIIISDIKEKEDTESK